jgi:hypothetical protein
MKRIRAILLAAATLAVGTAVTLSDALTTILTQEGVSCSEAATGLTGLATTQRTFFGAIADGFTPPDVTTHNAVDYPLGVCAAGECVVSVDGCPGVELRYSYELSSSLGGWRMYRLQAPEQFGHSWWALAQANPAQFRFWRSYKDAGADCVAAGYTAAQCRTLANEVNPCWKRVADGGVCHKGRLFNLPGSGGKDLCDPAGEAGWQPYPCGSNQPDAEAAQDGGF